MDLELWLVFLGLIFLNSIFPGPGAIITINHAFLQGCRKTLPLIVGQEIAIALMVPIVSIGSEILRTSETAWLLLKLISVLWLLFTAYKTWRSPLIMDSYDIPELKNNLKLFVLGFITNITNVKALAFLLTTLSLFIKPQQYLNLQIAIITSTMTIVDTLIMMFYALISVSLRTYFQSPKSIKQKNRLFAGFLLLIAISIFLLK